MSAKRNSLLLAPAALAACLGAATTSHAQYGAYGAQAVVEHNDLRWFEPVDLDLDGQMPHRDAGYFLSADKLWWGTINPQTEIGEPGLVVNSEQIFRAPSPELAILFVEQLVTTDFIGSIPDAQDRVQAALTFGGIIIEDANGNNVTGEITSVENLKLRLREDDPTDANFARPGGDPEPYGVKNGIQDALPDAGFAWGERFEFGYSDGEQGWMVTVLDGPEARAGGTYGAGEASPYTSQTNRDVYGPDPYFLGDLQDDDGDGRGDGDGEGGASDIFALGFGSVAVNFALPNPDFLRGFRDYDNGQTPWTTSGPILYVGNVGSTFTELIVTGFTPGVPPAGAGTTASLAALDGFLTTLAANPTGDPGSAVLETAGNAAYSVVASELAAILAANQGNATITALVGQIDALAGLLDGTGNSDITQPPNPPAFDDTDANEGLNNSTQVGDATTLGNQIRALLTTLNNQLVGGGGGTGGQGTTNVQPNNEQRQADDLNGNANQGFTRVFAEDAEGNLVEIGRVIDFGDLHTFNVFFDEVTVRNRTEIDGVELMRMHQLSTRHKLEQGRWDNLRFSWGLRFVDLTDNFYFQGLGSILGRTTVETDVENQIIGPQLGLQWVRRDGPWSFVLEGRGTFGYNIVDVDQYGIFGEEAIPGALNRSATARTTTTVQGERFDEFSPIAEIRAQLQYRLAESISLQAGYTAKYIGNIHRGGLTTAWNAPDFGINDRTSDIFVNGLNLGIELRH